MDAITTVSPIRQRGMEGGMIAALYAMLRGHSIHSHKAEGKEE
jgi:hypothetical protein